MNDPKSAFLLRLIELKLEKAQKAIRAVEETLAASPVQSGKKVKP